MTLPSVPSTVASREYLRIGGGCNAPALGASPAGGVDIDNAGNVAADGDLTVGGDVAFSGNLAQGAGGVDKTWSLSVSAADLWPDATAGPTGPALTVFSDNRYEAQSLTYSDSTSNRAYALLLLPPDFDGSPLRFTLYWTCTVGGASGSVVWSVGALFAADTEDITGTPTPTYYGVTDALTAVGRLQIADITFSAPAAKPTMWIQILRDWANAADTLNAACKLIGVRVTYA